VIFVDTGAWFAAAVTSDPDHSRASAFIAGNRDPYVTTDYVVDELLTLFTSRGLNEKGVEWIRNVLEAGGARLERVTPADFAAALEVYERFQDKSWSFTDCTSYVVIGRLEIRRAFSFDQHFRQFGNVAVVP
jgi:predicted nucleic acid-binding protein